MHKLSFKSSFWLCFLLLSCNINEEQINEDTAQSENTDQIVPHFKPSGGSSSPEELRPLAFCDVYLSADAFIFGSIVSIEMTEEPFATVDPETGAPGTQIVVDSLDQCASITPALKINVEVTNFFSNYGITQQNVVSLYIGYNRASYMEPKPNPDFNWSASGTRLNSSAIIWEGGTCENSQSCSLDIGHQLGFFANLYVDENENKIWYLSDYVFWANSLSNNENLSNLYADVQNKLSMQDIQDSVEVCKGQPSEIAASRRGTGTDRQSVVISYALPKCTMK